MTSHNETPLSIDWDESAIDLFTPLLDELLSADDPPPRPQIDLLEQLKELIEDLDDICARLSSRPLDARQMRELAGIELLTSSLSVRVGDFVTLFRTD